MKRNILYLKNVLDSKQKGWLRVQLCGGDFVEIQYLTKVKLEAKHEQYEEVTIMDGYYKSKKAKIPYFSMDKSTNYSFLEKNVLSKKQPEITLATSQNKLFINKIQTEVVVDSSALTKGKYLINFPVKSKKILNSSYLDENTGGSRFAETWFPIIKSHDTFAEKYLHFGLYSEGCITVKYKKQASPSEIWKNICMSLLASRNKNNKGLTYLEIK